MLRPLARTPVLSCRAVDFGRRILDARSDPAKTPWARAWPRDRPTGPSARDTGAGRAFHQDRLSLWAKVGFFFTFGFLALDELMYALSVESSPDPIARSLHIVVVVVWGGAWMTLRQRTLSRGALDTLDAAIVLVGCPLSALYAVLDDPLQYYTYLPALIVFIGSVGRALFVPSTARRTLAVSAAIAGLVHLALVLRTEAEVAPLLPTDALTILNVAFSASAVVLATVASHVIYGLRQQVRKALQLGQYTLEEKLGEGGMGAVYRARHAMLRRPTAVKLLPAEKAGEGAVARFEREVQLTALLSHPNTVAVFDYGHTPDGVFYYAMEYLDGIDLDSLVRRHGPQPPARVVHILEQICGSLAEAHESGLIHRDIKPANVILCERGGTPDVAKVVDFGLVKDLEGADDITKADSLQGTPLYLSPEAIRGAEVDPRSDLYAVGAVGYFLLSGAHVFEGGTLVEICSHHLHSTPRPPSERLGRPLPGNLEGLILACLAKEPERRPQTARELRRTLALEGGAGRWTEEQARIWWAERGQARDRGATEGPLAEDGVSALSVSLDDRVL